VPVVLFPSDASFPCNKARSASTSIFSRPAQRLLALQPVHSPSHLVTLSTGGFSRVVTFPTAPIATGRNDLCREGLAPSQEPRLSTAHLIRDLPGDRLFCPRHPRARRIADLTPAPGGQDHTISSSAPCRSSAHKHTLRHVASTASHPACRDDRDTPLLPRRDTNKKAQFLKIRK
jgi:hypothetical protein